MNIDTKIIKQHFLGEEKRVRLRKGGLSLYGRILETQGDCIVFQTRTQTSIIPVRDIEELLLVRGGGQ